MRRRRFKLLARRRSYRSRLRFLLLTARLMARVTSRYRGVHQKEAKSAALDFVSVQLRPKNRPGFTDKIGLRRRATTTFLTGSNLNDFQPNQETHGTQTGSQPVKEE